MHLLLRPTRRRPSPIPKGHRPPASGDLLPSRLTGCCTPAPSAQRTSQAASAQVKDDASDAMNQLIHGVHGKTSEAGEGHEEAVKEEVEERKIMSTETSNVSPNQKAYFIEKRKGITSERKPRDNSAERPAEE